MPSIVYSKWRFTGVSQIEISLDRGFVKHRQNFV